MAFINKDRFADLFKDSDDSVNRRKSLFITTLLATALVIMFTFFGFKTPLPLPAEQGAFVLVGFDDGDPAEEVMAKPSKEVLAEEELDKPEEMESESAAPQEESPLETGAETDAPQVNDKESEEKPAPAAKEKPVPDEPPTKPSKSEGEELAEDLNELFSSSKSKPKGDETNNNRSLGENAVTFQKTGFGSVGIVEGTGLSLLNMPDIDEKTQENADVFIKIKVDKYGKVLEARNDVARSTTTNLSLINKSIENAKKSTFARTDSGAMITEAVLEYRYRLN